MLCKLSQLQNRRVTTRREAGDSAARRRHYGTLAMVALMVEASGAADLTSAEPWHPLEKAGRRRSVTIARGHRTGHLLSRRVRDYRQVLSRELRYPCFYEPSFSPDWKHPEFSRAHGRVEMIRVNSASYLIWTYESLGRFRQGVLVQEMIQGSETALVDLYACYTNGGTFSRPVRHTEAANISLGGRGPGASVRSDDGAGVRDLDLVVLDRLHYQGPGAVCFKCQLSGGGVAIVEVNARLPLHHGLASFCGIDLAWIGAHHPYRRPCSFQRDSIVLRGEHTISGGQGRSPRGQIRYSHGTRYNPVRAFYVWHPGSSRAKSGP